MDKRIYERLFTAPAPAPAYSVIELSNIFQYDIITPLVLLYSMLIWEKEYMIKKLSEVELEYGNICKYVEDKLNTHPRKDLLGQYNFSEESLCVISSAILNKNHYHVTLFDLLSELTKQSEVSDLLCNKVFEESDIDEQTGELCFDPVTGKFDLGQGNRIKIF